MRMLSSLLVVLAFLTGRGGRAEPAAETGGVLRLILMPANPTVMDWSNPRALLLASITGLVTNRDRAIGHVSVEVSCPTLGGNDSRFISGAAPVTPIDPARLLFKDQVGFSILEASWLGRLESAADVMKSVKIRKKSRDKLAIMSFLISEKTCRRLLEYHFELANSPNPIYYGNSPRPRYREGSGCSAYGVSFLELAGLMQERYRKDWAVAVRVPLALMGGYGKPKVSVPEILRSPVARRWAGEDEPHMYLETFEPTWMYRWVRDLAEHPEKLRAEGGVIDRSLAKELPLTPAVLFDRRTVPTPQEPAFLSEPRLEAFTQRSVVRADKREASDGSFLLLP